jgi:hypothetical protein
MMHIAKFSVMNFSGLFIFESVFSYVYYTLRVTNSPEGVYACCENQIQNTPTTLPK